MPHPAEKILISACLLGERVRFDGKGKLLDHPFIKELIQQGRLVAICPEIVGGLPVPRPPAEIQQTIPVQVVTEKGIDVTRQFQQGAEQALALCRAHNIRYALLKARSPSCGNAQIYDGSFQNVLIDGMGITAQLLDQNGVRVFNEAEMDLLEKALN